MDDFENLDDDQIQQLIQLGIIPDENAQLQQQIEQAQALRNGEAPKGRFVRDGIYVAASPLEHIARAAQGIKAQHDLKNLYQQQQDLFGQQVAGRQAYFDALRDRTRVGRGRHSYTIGQPKMQDFQLDPSLVPPPEY
jgi:hypothetical protein